MLMNKLKSSIRAESAEQPARLMPYLVDDFQRILEQECHAADQTGREFSLLVFEFSDNPPGDGLLQNLWQVIDQHVRRTDKIGWLSRRSLGVILPETPFANSRTVAEEVCRILEAAGALVSYKILTYPRRSF
jgi:PleD family two-component response regulator